MRKILFLTFLFVGTVNAQTVSGPAGLYKVNLPAGVIPDSITPTIGPAGPYSIVTTGDTTFTTTVINGVTTVTISWSSGPSPPPPPPPPKPDTVTGHLLTLIIVDQNDPKTPPELLALLKDKSKIVTDIKSKNLDSDIVIMDKTNDFWKGWIALTNNQFPSLIVAKSDTAANTASLITGYPQPAPTTEAAIISNLSSLRSH